MSQELVMVKTFRILSFDKVMASATEAGRINGRDDDWESETIQEAIEELEVIGDGSPVDNGYEVISTKFS